MQFWRAIAGDRSSGGALCALLVLTLVFQVLLSTAAMAAMAGPGAIICTAAPDGTHRTTTPDHIPECACGLLCQAGMAVPSALAASDAPSLPIRFADRVERVAEAPVPAREPRTDSRRQARAPPVAFLQS